MQNLEVRFYTPEKFSSRTPQPHRRRLNCLQLDHRNGDGKVIRAEDILDYDPCARPVGDSLLSSLNREMTPILETYNQDCVNIAVADGSNYGVTHLTWRGLISGQLEDFLSEFDPCNRKMIVAPFLRALEFGRDNCLGQVEKVFPGMISDESLNQQPVFEFGAAIASVLEEESVRYIQLEEESVLASKRGGREGTNLLRIGKSDQFSPSDKGEIVPWPIAA